MDRRFRLSNGQEAGPCTPSSSCRPLNDPRSDIRLVELARRGDRDAFRRIVERHQDAVAATVIGMLGPGDEADDVGQETFIRLYMSLGAFRGDSALRTYLTKIAMNLSLNALKRRKRQAQRVAALDAGAGEQHSDPSPSPHGRLEGLEARQAVRSAIDELDEKHRSIVVLRMLRGLSTKETAATLGLPEGTVLSRLSRAMKKLEARLQPWTEAQ